MILTFLLYSVYNIQAILLCIVKKTGDKILIIRQPLREQIYENILLKIEDGNYKPGERLSDVNVAIDLRVSRTPVREALLRLEQEGLVNTELGYGFAVRPLSVSEISEKYPILSALECLALRSSRLPSATLIKKLDKLNDLMINSGGNAARLMSLDEQWHSLLLSNCENKSLVVMIVALKTNLRRYELAYMRDARRVAVSTEHHSEITRALADGDLESALEWLERNWVQTTEQLAEWLIQIQKT